MAEIIPSLTKDVLARMTSGEKRFAWRLKDLLEDDYLCWYDIPIGKQRRYPDFIILHPARGLLFLEVKDWKASTLKGLNKHQATLQLDDKRIGTANPLEQARQCMLQVVERLTRDQQLVFGAGSRYQGKLCLPYAWGTVFTNITRQQMESTTTEAQREEVLPDRLVIYKNEMQENTDPEAFQKRLWDMFNHQFPQQLTLPQVDRIRWHLFPEVRIDVQQQDLFGEAVRLATTEAPQDAIEALPDIVRILDVQQEQLARSLGGGHRVIHGVAGSGKTLILGYRCELLAATSNKPILVLCFNITLARKLESMMQSKGLEQQVQALYFHDWCKRQLNTYQMDVRPGPEPFWQRQVKAVIEGVEQEQIPRAQYGAVLIDEGHDFEADWLRLVVQMIDPESDSLLLLYDDAQSIYRKTGGLDFSLSSVGIKARGRTTILKLNYRNTREILDFAYRFAHDYIASQDSDDDHIPVIAPESAGITGPRPEVHLCDHFLAEMEQIADKLRQWQAQGLRWNEMAVLYAAGHQGSKLSTFLKHQGFPVNWLGTQNYKRNYNPLQDEIVIMALPSSKGLEFPAVAIAGCDGLPSQEQDMLQSVRLLYVGLTRARQHLTVTCCQDNLLTRHLLESA